MYSYAKTFLGIPYRWWNPDVSCCENTGPFWSAEGPEVSLEEVQKGHANCAGLLNLICRKYGLPIPGSKTKDYYAGGTVAWWTFFETEGNLQPFDIEKEYPMGTILLRKYRSVEDQGHIAIVCEKDKIIHSWPETGVAIADIQPDYYEAVVIGFLEN